MTIGHHVSTLQAFSWAGSTKNNAIKGEGAENFFNGRILASGHYFIYRR
jgi:hypothetical protein